MEAASPDPKLFTKILCPSNADALLKMRDAKLAHTEAAWQITTNVDDKLGSVAEF